MFIVVTYISGMKFAPKYWLLKTKTCPHFLDACFEPCMSQTQPTYAPSPIQLLLPIQLFSQLSILLSLTVTYILIYLDSFSFFFLFLTTNLYIWYIYKMVRWPSAEIFDMHAYFVTSI